MHSQDELDAMFTKAAATAAKVPKSLQEVAFNRALDHLLRGAGDSGARRTAARPTAARATDEPLERLPDLDRTKHPDVGATNRLADRALKVLELALNHYNVDGLGAAKIADILTKSFRLPAKANAVAMALGRERMTVNLRRDGGKNLFHIMQPGEDYLKALRAKKGGSDLAASAGQPATHIKHRRPKAQTESVSTANRPLRPKKIATQGSRQKESKSTRPGPKAAIEKLIGSGYFRQAHTISDVRGELKHALGYDFSVQELSISLVRLLRSGQLKRDRNQNEQYEYRV